MLQATSTETRDSNIFRATIECVDVGVFRDSQLQVNSCTDAAFPLPAKTLYYGVVYQHELYVHIDDL